MEGQKWCTRYRVKIDEALSQIFEVKVCHMLNKIAREIWKEDGNKSVVIHFHNGESRVFCKGSNGKSRLMKLWGRKDKTEVWFEGGEKDNIGDLVIVACELATRAEMKGSWEMVPKSQKKRIEAIMGIRGKGPALKGCVPSLVCLGEKTSPNMRVETLTDDEVAKIEAKCKIIEKILGNPEEDKSPLTKKKIVWGTAEPDKIIVDKLNGMRKYVQNERVPDDRIRKIFKKVISRIARNGPDAECLEILSEAEKRITGAKRPFYGIGAYIQSANIFLQFSRVMTNSNELNWFPLRYGTSKKGMKILNSMKDEKVDVVEKELLMTKMGGIKPRILCILKDSDGKKVVNGCVYDTKALLEESPSQVKEMEEDTTSTDVNAMGDKQLCKEGMSNMVSIQHMNKTSYKQALLPIQVMMKSDEHRRVQQSYRESCKSNTTDIEIEESQTKTLEVENNELTKDKDTGKDEQENNDFRNEITEKNCTNVKENNNGSSEDKDVEDRRAHEDTEEVYSGEEPKSNPNQGTRAKRSSPTRRATMPRSISCPKMCRNTNIPLRTITENINSNGLEAVYKIGEDTLEITVNIDRQLIGNRKIIVNVVAGKEKRSYDLPDAQDRKMVVQRDRTSIFGRKVEARNRMEGNGGMGEMREKEGCQLQKQAQMVTKGNLKTRSHKEKNNNVWIYMGGSKHKCRNGTTSQKRTQEQLQCHGR